MLQKKYKSKLISITNPIAGIFTLEFQSLSGKYKYSPGQFLHLALDTEYDGTGQWPDSRCFSMQSCPDEEFIKITYAVKGQFTGQMEQQLKISSEVWLKLPYGDLFTQPHNKTNTVFIAGGTGITPFLSLFTHGSFNEYTNPRIYLGFRSKDHHIYRDDLERMTKIRAIHSNSCNSDEWNSPLFVKSYYQDEEGIININQIFEDNGSASDYFISGPPAMINAFKQVLNEKGVPAGNVLTDDWE